MKSSDLTVFEVSLQFLPQFNLTTNYLMNIMKNIFKAGIKACILFLGLLLAVQSTYGEISKTVRSEKHGDNKALSNKEIVLNFYNMTIDMIDLLQQEKRDHVIAMHEELEAMRGMISEILGREKAASLSKKITEIFYRKHPRCR